jgi:probable phosphoglycerate mutase
LKSKKIYLIRHGETEFNKKGLVQGSGIDSNLNPLGHAQAQAFFAHYEHLRFDKIYVSGLKRTQQSVQPFIDRGGAFERLPGLNELSWGIKEGKPLQADDNMQHYYMLEAWREGMLDVKVEGGESPLEVQARQRVALAHIMAQTHEELILICMHGRALRIFLCLLLDLDLKDMDQFEHSNLSLYVLHYQHGSFRIELANQLGHLAHLTPGPVQAH